MVNGGDGSYNITSDYIFANFNQVLEPFKNIIVDQILTKNRC